MLNVTLRSLLFGPHLIYAALQSHKVLTLLINFMLNLDHVAKYLMLGIG
jgi:hypothetical protein